MPQKAFPQRFVEARFHHRLVSRFSLPPYITTMAAATDPLLSAWVDNTSPNGGEIGDLCAWTFGPGNLQGADVLWNRDPYIAQQEWSNAISGCTLTTNNANRYYQIVNRNSGLVMDVYGGGTNADAQVIQWTNPNGLNQQWSLIPTSA
jgi:Ricin-type beta-trefoil lectin domain-like